MTPGLHDSGDLRGSESSTTAVEKGRTDTPLGRYERKAVVAEVDCQRLQQWVWDHPLAFRSAFSDRIVHSLYFDSRELGHLSDNLAGIANRVKLRLRWYGDSSDTTRTCFEIKAKRNELGYKFRCDVALSASLQTLSLARVLDEIRAELPADMRAQFDAADHPQLHTRYSREYFVSGDGRVRATLDRGISIFGQSDAKVLNGERAAFFPPVAVLELKYAAKLDAWLRRHTTPLPSRLSRFSKYTVGMQTLLGV